MRKWPLKTVREKILKHPDEQTINCRSEVGNQMQRQRSGDGEMSVWRQVREGQARVETDLQHYKRSRRRTDRTASRACRPMLVTALDSRGVSSNSRQVQEFRGIG